MQRPRNSELGKRIGEKVRSLRTARNWKQADLADKLGCHQPDVSEMESGKHVPQIETLVKLANLFSIPLNDLVGG